MTKKKDVGCMKQGIDYEICKECRATYTLDKIGFLPLKFFQISACYLKQLEHPIRQVSIRFNAVYNCYEYLLNCEINQF